MNLNEQILDKLINAYRAKGLSVDRVLMDPMFRSLSVEDRIKAVVKFGHDIKAGQKRIDTKLVSDAVIGAAGTALALEPFTELAHAGLLQGWHQQQGTKHPSWVDTVTSKKNVLGLTRAAIGGSIMANEIGNVKRFMRIRKAIQSNVVDGEDISQDQAINVISATLR